MRPRGAGPRPALLLALALLAAGALALLVHDRVEHVDFVSFAGRARRLRAGQDLVHPLYPVGYPALLSLAQALTGDVLWAGKALAVAAGAGAVAAVAALVGPLPALWVLGQGALLQWGATEGTDMPAAALALGAVAAAARRRPTLAGALVGAACLCRYTGVAALPAVLLLAGRPGRVLVALAVATAPHWAVALATGGPLLPDQSENLAIAAGRPTALWSLDTLRRWPGGLALALRAAAWHPPTWVGAAGLAVGVLRGDRRAGGLLALALTHIAILGLAFANPRLALPATLALAAGAAFLVPRRWPRAAWALPLAALPVAWGAVSHLDEASPADLRRADQARALAAHPGRFLTSDPWVATRAEGWLHGGVPLREVGEARALTPALVARHGRKSGIPWVMVDAPRVQASHPGLEALLGAEDLPGLVRAGGGEGWRLWGVEGVADLAGASPRAGTPP